MATLTTGTVEDVRRPDLSPRPKGRGKSRDLLYSGRRLQLEIGGKTLADSDAGGTENAKDTLCRNVTIYGHCRYEDKGVPFTNQVSGKQTTDAACQGCAFNHDPIKSQPNYQVESIKKRFNIASPSFTPSSLAVNGNHATAKPLGLSPKAANAAPFKPRTLIPAPSAASSSISSTTASLKQYNPNAPDWIAPDAQEFLPQTYNTHSHIAIAMDGTPDTGTNENDGVQDLSQRLSAFDFWSLGAPSLRRRLGTPANGNRNHSGSTALTKKPGNSPADRDPAESAPAHSKDRRHCSGIPPSLEPESTPAPSSGVDVQARQMPDPHVSVLDEIGGENKQPRRPSPRDPVEIPASEAGAGEQSLEVEAQERHPTVSASASNSSTKSQGGKEHGSLTSADAPPSQSRRAVKATESPLEVEDDLQGRARNEQPKPAIATGPSSGNEANSRPGRRSEPSFSQQRQNSFTPPKQSRKQRQRRMAPGTPTGHLKSLSADTPGFHPRPPWNSPTTPAGSYGGSHGWSLSTGFGHQNPGYASVIPNTPAVGSGVFQSPGGALQSPRYPEPHQHTPEGPGPWFDSQASMPLQMPIESQNSFGPNLAPVLSQPHAFDNTMNHYNAHPPNQGEQNAEYSQPNHFDSYAASQAANAAPNAADLHQNGSMYTQDTNGYGPGYYSNHTDPSHQLNHNLYYPLEPHREPSKSDQRTAKDLFIPEDIRQKLHARTEATLRVFAVMNVPAVEPYHTLTPLTSVVQQQSQTWRGYPSTTYKAVSAKDGRTYCLRRIHDFQATRLNESAILAVRQKWTAVKNSNVVSPHFAFTTAAFHDASLIVVSDYHPSSKTIAETHFHQTSGRAHRNAPPLVPEQVLWGYIVQITNALKAIHSAKLAVRVIEPTKVIVTDEGRIRLNGCALEDLLDGESHEIADLQRLDFHKFGNFILAVGTVNMPTSSSRARAPDVFSQNYSKSSPQLKAVVEWLLDHDRPENNEGIDVLIRMIGSHAVDAFDKSLGANDHLYFSLNKEVENSRIVRLMTKFNCLNERPEYEHDRTYSTQGPRAVLGLFRDFVFHQVDAQANPVVDMGHILSCLNKLDAGIEERIALTTRDEQSVIVASYKELKGALEGMWQELTRRSTG